MDCSMPGFPVHHQLLELAQTHAHWVNDAIQPSHPLSSPSPAFNFSQHQGLFQRVSSSHQVAKALVEHRFYIELVYTHTHTDYITKSISWELLMDKDDVVYVYICTHTYNGTLLNHKKVWNNAIWSNMDELRDYHTKESKSERERQILIPYDIYVESKKWHRWTCLQEKTDLHT